MKEYRLKVEGAGKGRPFDMVELDDGTVMKKREYVKTPEGKVFLKAQKAQAKANAQQAKASEPAPVEAVTPAIPVEEDGIAPATVDPVV